jgi:cyanophycin synthetase
MKIVNIKVFEGRNTYSHRKCIRMDLDLEGYSEIPSRDIEDFNYNLIRFLPELNKHRCGIDESAGFIKRLKEGTYLAHICEHIIIAIQNILGMEVAYGKAREIEGDRYYIIYQYEYKETAIRIGRLAVDIVNSLIYKRTLNFDDILKEIQQVLNQEFIGPSTGALCDEAQKMGIPVMKIEDTGLYQLGLGKYGRFIEATICEDTRAVGVDISCDKIMTKSILELNCLPVAKGCKIKSALELLLMAEKVGYPIVLKPQCGHQGQGVYVNIKNEKEALKIFKKLIKVYEEIILEKYIVGNDYRVCVVDGEVIAVALRMPPFVVGDGKKDIKTLIDIVNRDPRRGVGHEKPLTRIAIDGDLINIIARNGYELNSILPENEKLLLRENANLSTGGIAIDCTEDICQENIEICKRAASAVGLNICGIDICCADISKPIGKDGAIIEINSAPGIRMHHYPYEGKSRNVAKSIVEMIFKDIPKTIPLVSVTGTNGKTTTTRLIGHTLSLAGYNVGMSTTGGIYVNNKCIEKGDTTGPESAMAVLLNREVDAAVLETARGGMIRGGLAYDLADVGVITNITDDHLGLDGVETLEDLADVKSLVVEAVKDDGYAVINADDPMSVSIVDRIKSNIVMFSLDKDNKLVRETILKGGIGVFIDRDIICVEKTDCIYEVVNIKDIGITLEGKLVYNMENSMAACAALVALGIDYYTISQGLSSFRCDEKNNPGRFNMYKLNGVTVVLDYGHNVEGYKSVLNGLLEMKQGRLVGIIGIPGDRLDSNILDVGRISGEKFDYIYIKEDADRRGRRKGEVAELLEKGVTSSGFNRKNIEVILDEKEALVKAMDTAKYGDIIIIFFEKYEPLLEVVKSRIENIDCINRIQEVMA